MAIIVRRNIDRSSLEDQSCEKRETSIIDNRTGILSVTTLLNDWFTPLPFPLGRTLCIRFMLYQVWWVSNADWDLRQCLNFNDDATWCHEISLKTHDIIVFIILINMSIKKEHKKEYIKLIFQYIGWNCIKVFTAGAAWWRYIKLVQWKSLTEI